MLQAMVKKGKVYGEEIPAPLVSHGSLLIKVVNSCISAGTEMSSVKGSGKSLIKRAMEQPQHVSKVLNMLKNDGILNTMDKVKGKLESGKPTGYSISGVVIGIGEGVTGFELGDRVAAAGAGIANHAEYVDVPVNLVMKMDKNTPFTYGAPVALGGIAMQGVRRVDLKFGEFCVVIGSGILGLLALQMLNVAGVRTIVTDLDERRLKIAEELGAEFVINVKNEDPVKIVENITGGYGADGVLFTAATSSNEPLSQAFKMCRRKGKVVLVGVSGMEIKRGDIYKKELDFLISTSYGPGRYDREYEEKGCDYPYAYVRWTEKRNMEEYLRLVSANKLNIEKLIDNIFTIEKVTSAYESLKGKDKPLIVLLNYGEFKLEKIEDYFNHLRNIKRIEFNKKVDNKKVGVAMIGTGGFATGVHLPNLKKLSDKYEIISLMNRSGHKAKSVADQYSVENITTNIDDIINNKDIDLVMICTRHDSHGELVLKLLESGKNVFVEKPLATTVEEIEKIKNFYLKESKKEKPLLTVGFNRRFSKYATLIREKIENRINPLFVHYRMNAGFIPKEHWVHENGGRIVGEACHIIDLMSYLTGTAIKSISVESLTPATEKYSSTDNKSIILKYSDGSICTIEYFAIGSKKFPKEYMEVHFDEKTIIMEDYKKLSGYGVNIEFNTENSQKGQLEELEYLYEVLKGDKNRWPIELWDMIQTSEVALKINSEGS